MIAALVMHNNQILMYKIFDQDGHGKHNFVTERKFQQHQRIFKHSETYKDVIDLFIFKNSAVVYGEGQYSMYVASTNGILIYEGVDKRDSASILVRPISNDYKTHTLTMGAIDCNAAGQIVFDLCSKE